MTISGWAKSGGPPEEGQDRQKMRPDAQVSLSLKRQPKHLTTIDLG